MDPTRHQRMSAVDTAWLRMDRPDNPMMIVGVTVTAGRVRLAAFRRVIQRRLLAFDRFRHRPVADALGASWVEDEHFDLDWHVRGAELPGPGDQQALETLVGELASSALDPERPRWQMHLVEHYRGGSAWILRLHHCYADGIAMVRVLMALTEDAQGRPLAEAPRAERRAHRRRSQPRTEFPLLDWIGRLSAPAGDLVQGALAEGGRLLEQGLRQMQHPDQPGLAALHAGGMLGELASTLALPDDPPTALRGALSGSKRVAWAPSLPLAEVRSVGKAMGCTINDVLMATVAGALGSHLRERDALYAGATIRAAMPVNLRRADEPTSLGNRFGMTFVDLPVGLRNPLERLQAVHATMDRLKGSLQPPMVLTVLGAIGLLPAAVQEPVIELFSRKGSAVVSNVPGPAEPLYLCRQRISEMYFWVPQAGSMGVGVSLFSYAGQVYVGMIADRSLVPEPAAVVGRFGHEFEQLLLAVTVGVLAARDRAAVDAGPGRAKGKPAQPKTRRTAANGRASAAKRRGRRRPAATGAD
jgi:WS/DGAT/MGAT family acyltransferase